MSDVTNPSSGNTQQGGNRRGKERSRDLITAMEERLARWHATMTDLVDKVEGMGQRVEERQSKGDELKEEMQGALNVVVDDFFKENKALKELIVAKDEELNACKAKLTTLDEHVEELKAQVKLCLTAVANGGATQITPTSKVNAHKPPTYSGARNAREIDNFLWGLFQCYRHCGGGT